MSPIDLSPGNQERVRAAAAANRARGGWGPPTGGGALILEDAEPVTEPLTEALFDTPDYHTKVWRVDLHPRDRTGKFRDALKDFLAKQPHPSSPNVLRARGGLTVQSTGSAAVVLHHGKETEVNLRPQQPDGLYKNLEPAEAEAAVAKAVDEVLAKHGDEKAIQDTGEDTLTNPARFAKAYDGFEHNGLKVRVNYARRLKDEGESGEMDADILDGDKIVGHVVRNFDRDEGGPFAYHNELRLDPAYQDRGFGGALSRHAEQGYRDGDIKRIDLQTDEVGGYAWARAGYEPKPAVDYNGDPVNVVGRIVSRRMSGVYRDQKDIGVPYTVPRELADRWPELMEFLGATPYMTQRFGQEVQKGWTWDPKTDKITDIAAWGSDAPVEVDGRQMWLGKWLLLGTEWDGSKRLD